MNFQRIKCQIRGEVRQFREDILCEVINNYAEKIGCNNGEKKEYYFSQGYYIRGKERIGE